LSNVPEDMDLTKTHLLATFRLDTVYTTVAFGVSIAAGLTVIAGELDIFSGRTIFPASCTTAIARYAGCPLD